MATNLFFQPTLKSTALQNDQVGAFSPNTELSLIGNITGTAPNGGAVVISNLLGMNSGNLLSIQNGPLTNVGLVGGATKQVFAVDYLGNVVSSAGFTGGLRGTAASVHTVTVLQSDFIITPVSSGAAITVQLPTPATTPVGKIFVVKDQAGNAATHSIIVEVDGTIHIDGAATQVLSTAYAAITVYNNGTTYSVLSTLGTVTPT